MNIILVFGFISCFLLILLTTTVITDFILDQTFKRNKKKEQQLHKEFYEEYYNRFLREAIEICLTEKQIREKTQEIKNLAAEAELLPTGFRIKTENEIERKKKELYILKKEHETNRQIFIEKRNKINDYIERHKLKYYNWG